MVRKAFAQLDKDSSGKITVADVTNIYDVTHSKEFKEGLKGKDEILNEFLGNFQKGTSRDGVITLDEFVDYYTDLSMSITSDDYFVQMMESVWCVGEDEELNVFKEQVEQLTSALRLKLRTMANQSSEEFVLRNIFKDFDVDQSGNLTINEFIGILNKLGISCDRKYISALFKKFDTNGNGLIEFEEFCNYMIYDAYK